MSKMQMSLLLQEIDQTKTRFADECPHVVTHTDLRPKSNVEVLWIAPPPGVGCMEFRYGILCAKRVYNNNSNNNTLSMI